MQTFLNNLTAWQLALLIWLIINLIVFVLYGYDKLASKTGNVRLRISEKALLILAACFGAGGALGAMLLFRHKTKHRNFMLLVPAMLVLQVAVMVWLCGWVLPR